MLLICIVFMVAAALWRGKTFQQLVEWVARCGRLFSADALIAIAADLASFALRYHRRKLTTTCRWNSAWHLLTPTLCSVTSKHSEVCECIRGDGSKSMHLLLLLVLVTAPCERIAAFQVSNSSRSGSVGGGEGVIQCRDARRRRWLSAVECAPIQQIDRGATSRGGVL